MSNLNIKDRYLQDGYNIIAEIDGNYIRDNHAKRIAEFDKNYVRKMNGNIIVKIDGNYIKDDNGKIITTLDNIKNDIDGADDCALVALWILFIRKKE